MFRHFDDVAVGAQLAIYRRQIIRHRIRRRFALDQLPGIKLSPGIVNLDQRLAIRRLQPTNAACRSANGRTHARLFIVQSTGQQPQVAFLLTDAKVLSQGGKGGFIG